MAKVLIVDDAAFMRMILKNILIQNGHKITGEAENGQKAIEHYKQHRPDIVTMDITMPDMNGITAVEKIKKIDPDAKIIMCSAMGQQAMVLDAVKAGAKDFIVKPFEKERVIDAVNKVIGARMVKE